MVSSRVRVRIRVKVRVSVLVRVSIRTSWVVNFALFRCYRPVIYTRPKCHERVCMSVCSLAYLNKSSAVAAMGDRATKKGLLCASFAEGELGPRLTQCGLGRGLPPYTKWHLDPCSRLATIDVGRKLGGAPPF